MMIYSPPRGEVLDPPVTSSGLDGLKMSSSPPRDADEDFDDAGVTSCSKEPITALELDLMPLSEVP